MKLTSSFLNRQEHLKAIKEKPFDLVVVGGGITGAGVARDAAMRGLSVCLVEKVDFGEGTSSRSSKLVHGGLRYLENFEFDLVSEALHERQNLLSMAPHMVKPLRFLMPLYEGDRVSPFKMKLGMILYDVLSAFNTPKFHESVSKKEILKNYPKIKEEGLRSGFLYSDALMDDDRLVYETLRSAVDHGAVVVSYVSADGYRIDDEGLSELSCFDHLSGEKFLVKAQHTVSCVGPWTDQFGHIVNEKWESKTRPSKGVHITIPKDKLNLKTAVVMASGKDQKRILFCIPREGFDIIGTTDTDFKGDSSLVRTEVEDVNYILEILKDYHPEVAIDHDEILFSYSGVRPLIDDGSASESKVSRSHWIKTFKEDRVTYISGGKYTTYLSMAEDCMSEVLNVRPKLSEKAVKHVHTRTPFVEFNSEENQKLSKIRLFEKTNLSWSDDEKEVFLNRHGAQGMMFLEKREDMSLAELEAHIAIHHYFCGTLRDFYFRRVPYLLMGLDKVTETLDEVSGVFQKELGMSDEELRLQIAALKENINFENSWRDSTY